METRGERLGTVMGFLFKIVNMKAKCCLECGSQKKQVKLKKGIYFYYCENYCENDWSVYEIGCEHEDHYYEDQQWTTIDNRKVVSSICKFCGHKNRGGLKNSKDKDNLPNADLLLKQYEDLEKEAQLTLPKLRDDYRNKKNEIRINKIREQTEKADKEWWDNYNNYIKNSPKWQNIRQKVLERDNGICQGCLINKANQVHHLTYKNVCNEFMFELISICEICHNRYHGK